jgi:hypothetical protein
MTTQFKDLAYQYHKHGFNVSCISYLKTIYSINEKNPEKSPNHDWKYLQIRRQERGEIENFLWEYSTGIGAILGSNQIVCIDIDECFDFDIIKNILKILFLPNDYEWIIKTPNGFHIYIRTEKLNLPIGINDKGIICLEPNEKHINKFKRVEFRYAGHAVLPNSKINESRYFFLHLNSNGKLQNNPIPTLAPLYVEPIIVLSTMAYTSGNYRKEEGFLYLADFMIGGYEFKFSEHSSGTSFEIIKNALKIYEIQYSENQITKRNKFDTKLYIEINTEGRIEDPTIYDLYPRVTNISFLIESNSKKNYSSIGELDFKYEFDNNKSILYENDESEKNIELKDVLDIITSKLNEPNLIIIFFNSEFQLSIFDIEFKKLGKRNPLRDQKHLCLKKQFLKHNTIDINTIDNLYENLFDNNINSNTLEPFTNFEMLSSCYKLMDIYGYFNGIPRSIMS